ncbi:MAG TPA: PAS domain S-box protein [Verrucomicrobiae bacterium]|nr:PAS domain S-box protein [Verrucomicrobiae bacterium]
MSIPIHVLFVEDSEDDTELALCQLRRAGFDPIHERVDMPTDLKAALDREAWDVVISDYAMPGFNGFDALKIVRNEDIDLPFILISGTIGEEIAVAAMKAGAHDYLMKGNLARLAPAIERELREAKTRRERKKTERVLQAIVNSSNDPIFSHSLEGIVNSWNPSAERLFGYSAAEIIGQPVWSTIVPQEKVPEEQAALVQLRAGRHSEHYESVRTTKDGRRLPVSITISPIKNGTGNIVGVSKIVRDITERKRAEAELEAWRHELEQRVQDRTAELTLAHRQLQAAVEEHRRLEAEVARAIEREQLRIGHELHDGLGQELTGINYMLVALQTKLEKKVPLLAREAKQLEPLLQHCIEQTRHLAKGFYPVELERLGLLVALEEIIRKPGYPENISYVVESDESAKYADFKGPVAIQLFRIAQEAVHNAIKHSQAGRIVVRLETRDGSVILTVRDDGVGLPPDSELKGMGLRIMQYRAETVGGTVSVENQPSKGVIVTCSVPIERVSALLPTAPGQNLRSLGKRLRHQVRV